MKRMGRDRVECDISVNIILERNHYRVFKTCKRAEKCILSSCTVTIFMQIFMQKKFVMHCTVYRMLDNPCKLKHCLEGIAMPKHRQSYLPKRGTGQREVELHAWWMMRARALRWIDGVSKRRVRYGGNREFKHLYIV